MDRLELGWKRLYSIGGVMALLLLVYSLATMVILLTIGGQPESAQEAFAMLQANRFSGLLRLDLLLVVCLPLYYPLILALFISLKGQDNSLAAMAALLGCAGVTLALATPSVFSWLALSDAYAAAASQAQRNLLLAAGEATLASDMWHGAGARMGGLLMQFALLLFSAVMTRSRSFSRTTAWLGLVTHGLDWLHILVGFFSPAFGNALMVLAGPLYLLWFPCLSRDLFKLRQAG